MTFSVNPVSVKVANILGSIERPRTDVGREQWSKMLLEMIDRGVIDIQDMDGYAYKMHLNYMAKYAEREGPLTNEDGNEISYSSSVMLSKYGVFDEDDYANVHEAVASVDDLLGVIDYQALIEQGVNLPRILLSALDYVENDQKAPTHIISNDDARICESLGIKVRDAIHTAEYNALLKLERENLKVGIKQVQADLAEYKRYVSSLCEHYRPANTYAKRKAIAEIHAEHKEELADREQRIELLQGELESLKPEKVLCYFDYVRLLLYKTGLETVIQEVLANKHLWAALIYRWSDGTRGYDPAFAV